MLVYHFLQKLKLLGGGPIMILFKNTSPSRVGLNNVQTCEWTSPTQEYSNKKSEILKGHHVTK